MLGVYVHWPWCIQKCPFCDFNAHHVKYNFSNFNDVYLKALEHNLLDYKNSVDLPIVGSIFFGGGTPSLIRFDMLDRILGLLNKYLHIASDVEISIEVNPGKLAKNYFRQLKRSGINRVSLGLQSFDAIKLKILGRSHSVFDNYTAIEDCMSVFKNVNFDIMYGLPNQDLDSAMYDLEMALQYYPEHISWYQLTIEEKTFFAKYAPKLPASDQILELEEQGMSLLGSSGMIQYEVSAFKREKICRHNMIYWKFQDYLGLGPGAHGKITNTSNKEILRTSTTAHPKLYVKRPDLLWSRVLEKDVILEYLLNVLRLKNYKITSEMFFARTFLDLGVLVEELRDNGLSDFFKIEDSSIQLTRAGFLLSQSILSRLGG